MENSKYSKYIPALTGLRTIAAFSVTSHHLEKLEPNAFGAWKAGTVGTIIFFTLSGYLIFQTYYLKVVDLKSFGSYWLKRFARIYPAYWLVLSFTLLATGAITRSSFKTLFLNFTLLQGYFYPAIWTGDTPITWSLTTEETFYLLAPLLFYFLRPSGKKNKPIIPLGKAFAVLVFLCWLYRQIGQWLISAPPTWELISGEFLVDNMAIFGRFPEFVPGILLSLFCFSPYFQRIKSGKPIATLWFLAGLAISWGGCLYIDYLYATVAPGSPILFPQSQYARSILSVGTALIIYASILGCPLGTLFLGNRYMVYLGKISYVVYLLNGEFILDHIYAWLKIHFSIAAENAFLFYGVLCIPAAIIYEYVETPIHRWLVRKSS